MSVLIRDATEPDLATVQAIYAWHVENGLASFEEIAPQLAEIVRRWRDVCSRNLPYLVAELDRQVVGYAYASPYRARSARIRTPRPAVTSTSRCRRSSRAPHPRRNRPSP